MTKIRFGRKQLPFPVLLLLLITTMIVTACGSALPTPAVLSAPIATVTPGDASAVTTAPIDTTAPGAGTAAQTNKSSRNPKCDALFLANYDIGMALAQMVNLTADTNYSAYTSPDSPFYMDFKKLRSELDTLATLPDPSAAEALIVGKPSEAIIYFHQLMALAETDIKNQGKPFVDTSPSVVKLIGIYTPLEQHAAVFGVAMGNVCKDYTAPSDLFAGTPAPGNGASQPTQLNDSAMATLSAAGASMEATINALSTTMPEPTETPTP